ncbi:methylthioribose kinase [Methylacidiphilum sp. Yel]|jgi:5-methylthioribose kinase|uniref:methylthioribose kinase n=1 Tax=Methylacidiphilum sp. Yel TaxID=1847730 RepID=UPI0010699F21|nr:methylthioribose kinase [Methylacidiphilum sp. Yel]TFE68474.1 methylthioribose kinase [Methylacidiphilum sp. Yel]
MIFSPFVSNRKNKRVPKDYEDWEKNFPELFFLEAKQPKVETYLQSIQFLYPKESILSLTTESAHRIDKIVRVETSHRTFLLKQSRPWIDCCPSNRAPMSRILKEAEFYSLCSKDPILRSYVSSLLYVDRTNYLLILSELGKKDCSAIYEKEPFSVNELSSLLDFLSYLHSAFYKKKMILKFENQAMRKYHWRNLFVIPMKQKKSLSDSKKNESIDWFKRKFLTDWKFYSAMKQAAYHYLDQGPTLIHGNFLPFSWIRTGTGIGISDFESMICGRPEIDIGLLLSHLLLAGLVEHFFYTLSYYRLPESFELIFAFKIAGAEIFRRCIGPGALRCLTPQKKENLLSISYKLLTEEKDVLFKSIHKTLNRQLIF